MKIPQLRASVLLMIVFTVNAASAVLTDPNNPTGTTGLIMIDKRGGFVRFFDPSTLAETAKLELEAPPHELAISPHGLRRCRWSIRNPAAMAASANPSWR